jgi:hypothetical protein
VGPMAGVNWCQKSRQHRDSFHGPSRPANRCTDSSFPAYITVRSVNIDLELGFHSIAGVIGLISVVASQLPIEINL